VLARPFDLNPQEVIGFSPNLMCLPM
jgi:hypothetical protein